MNGFPDGIEQGKSISEYQSFIFLPLSLFRCIWVDFGTTLALVTDHIPDIRKMVIAVPPYFKTTPYSSLSLFELISQLP